MKEFYRLSDLPKPSLCHVHGGHCPAAKKHNSEEFELTAGNPAVLLAGIPQSHHSVVCAPPSQDRGPAILVRTQGHWARR